jgi:hypothetical protein
MFPPPCDPSCIIAREDRNHVGDVVGVPEPSERSPSSQLLDQVLIEHGSVRVRDARGGRAHPDAALAEFVRERPDEPLTGGATNPARPLSG